MRMDNPFFHRGAIRRADEFHGREDQIGQILGLFHNGQSVSIVGPRRIGKSSLLLHLRRQTTRFESETTPEEAIIALVDCQELGGSPPEEVYEALMTSIMEDADLSGREFSAVERPGTYRSLDLILGEEKNEERIRASLLPTRFFILSCSKVLNEKKAASDPEK